METLSWEKIHSDKERRTLRLRVPGGWVYLIVEKPTETRAQSTTSVFVPDPSPY